jgi:hypothetical protein
MTEKQVHVLVSYLERKKVFTLSTSVPNQLELLKDRFRKEFKFEHNVNLDISFQRYDPEWDDHVDLDKDSVLQEKEKLKAVVTPILASAFSVRMIQSSESLSFTFSFSLSPHFKGITQWSWSS